MYSNKSPFNSIKKTINIKMNLFYTKKLKPIIISVYIILIDQFSKYIILNLIEFEESKNIIPDLLNFTLVKNKGAAFSLFSNSTTILTITSFIASLLIITILLKATPKSNFNLIGLSYLLGGTVGNGIDRLFKGYVIDFIDIVPINFPIFNVADISINIAIICFIIDLIKTKNHSKFNY